MAYLISQTLCWSENPTITTYRETAPLTFTNIGELKPITAEFKIEFIINLGELAVATMNAERAVEHLRETLNCSKFFQVCLHELDDMKRKTKATANTLINISHNRRHKRTVEFIGTFYKWAFGIMNEEDRNEIKKNVANLKSQDDEIINQMSTSKTILVDVFDHLNQSESYMKNFTEAVQSSFDKLSTHITSELTEANTIKRLNNIVNDLEGKILAIEDMITSKHISPNLITPEKMRDALKKLKIRAPKERFPFESIIEIAAGMETELTITSTTIKASITLPSSTTSGDWSLYQITKNPVIIGDTVFLHTTNSTLIAKSSEGEVNQQSINSQNCFKTVRGLNLCKILNPVVKETVFNCERAAILDNAYRLDSCGQTTAAARIGKSTITLRKSLTEILVITNTETRATSSCGNNITKTETFNTPTVISTKNSPCTITLGDEAFYLIPTEEIKITVHIKAEFNTTVNKDSWKLEKLPSLKSSSFENLQKLGENIKELQTKELKIKTDETAEIINNIKTTIINSLTSVGIIIIVIIVSLIILCCLIKR